MTKAYYSTVLEHPVDDVWALVRDFNDYPRYIDGVDQSLIEDGRSGDSIGAVRRFRYGGSWIRQRLVAHSDLERSFTYAGLDPFPFPEAAAAGETAPAAIEYAGTLRITPVVDGDRSFVEWWVSFEGGSGERERWERFLTGAISQWLSSLRAHLPASASRASSPRQG